MELDGKEVKIEEALKELEKIVAKLENGKENLEESLKLYKKGMQLCVNCEDELKKAKLEISCFDVENLEE